METECRVPRRGFDVAKGGSQEFAVECEKDVHLFEMQAASDGIACRKLLSEGLVPAVVVFAALVKSVGIGVGSGVFRECELFCREAD